jgi:torulene dioxygenase
MYTSRRSNDKVIENIKKTGRYGWITFAQRHDPCIGIFGKLMSIYCPTPKEPANLNIAVTLRPNHPGLKSARESSNHSKGLRSLWAASDHAFMKEIDPETLEPIGLAHQTSLHPDLTGPLSCAHSQTDPETGDMFNYNLAFGRYGTYRVFKTSPSTGETEILATITGPGVEPAYIHSFFMTKDYVVLGVWGAHVAWYGFKVLLEQNMLDALAPFNNSKPVKWFVVDRRHGRGLVAEFESPANFSFHTVNAWQEMNDQGGVDIVCDYFGYENLDVMKRMYYSNMVSGGEGAITMQGEKGKTSIPQLFRYRLSNIGQEPLARDGVPVPQAELIFKTPKHSTGDLPTVNPRFKMIENRYAWSIVNRGYSAFLDGISKFDLKTKEVMYWQNPRGHTPGEAIFVPNPDGVDEDDGVLLSVVLDGFKETSYLVCLDARTMKELGRAECDWAVGLGTHGAHIQGQTVLA